LIRVGHFQHDLEFGKSECVFVYEVLCPYADDGVEVRLDASYDLARHVDELLWFEDAEEMTMILALGYVDRSLAGGIA
jgi:hypothetical protein